MISIALNQPTQRHVNVIEVRYPQSTLSWTPPREDWRFFAQLVQLNAGRCTAYLKGAELTLDAPSVFWLPPGMLRRIEFIAGASGRVVTVSEDWLIPAVQGLIDPDIPYRSLADTVHTVHQASPEFAQRIGHSMDAVKNELMTSALGARSVVAAQIMTVLTYLHRVSGDDLATAATGIPGSPIYKRFVQLIELHFREHWKVADYAAHMGVTERRLETATRRDAKQSPVALIQRKVLFEACQRLEHSPLSIAEVAYGLGFKDPAYFNRFFRRHTGAAPGAWRRAVRANEPQLDTSYAAWP